MKPIKGNIVDKSVFEERMDTIVDYTASAVAKTLGPYGHKALIQTTDGIVSTKDGWNVLQNIKFDNIIDNSIKSMIEAVAHSVVLKVGDGTTTSMYLSNVFLKELRKEFETFDSGELSIREIEDTLESVINMVEERLRVNARDVDKENLHDTIFNIAMVSSNWDAWLSEMIADIYEETHNPIIKVQDSGTDKTYKEIIDGYELSGRLMSDMYINNFSDKTCELENPMILMLNFQINDRYFTPLSLLGGICQSFHKDLIVMSPGFDNAFVAHLNNGNLQLRSSNGKVKQVNLIPVQYDAKFSIDRKCIEDFAILTNATLVPKNDTEIDIEEFFDDVTKWMTNKVDMDNNPEFESKADFMKAAFGYLENICGTCGYTIINDRGIIVQNLLEGNEEVIKNRMTEIESEINKKTLECDALTMITDDIRQKRIRLGKLQGKMGVIKVGGFGEGDLKAKKDAVDDTTRACEAAYRYGYTIGGSIAPLIAISDILNTTEELTSLSIKVLGALLRSYTEVFAKIYTNKHPAFRDRADEITKQCIQNRCGYDIISETFDTDTTMTRVLNPVNVDIEIIRSCLRLVLLAMTSDQFLYKQYHDVNPFTEEEPEVVELDSNIKTNIRTK